ncbi:hypothetical protein RND81_02G116000 [Saponaria officinalis]|uniref:Replication protein A 70 kDa DNA-binding subunit B/D first OB fold domain-containing protein n=1 Tax=Saponaria officinalis TaxID=3572 RepID=A0AAW1MPT0_SAPOF
MSSYLSFLAIFFLSMSPIQIDVADLTDKSRDFFVLVTLEAILPAKTARSGTSTYQNLFFRDNKGTEITATLFGQDIGFFAGVLQEGKEYCITSPTITPVPENIRRVSHKYQMELKATTQVVESSPTTTNIKSYYVPLDAITDYINRSERADVIAVAIIVLPTRKVPSKTKDEDYDIHDIVLLDKSLKPTIVSVWRGLCEAEIQLLCQIIDSMPVVCITEDRRSVVDGVLARTNGQLFSIKLVPYKIGESHKQLRFRAQSVEKVTF